MCTHVSLQPSRSREALLTKHTVVWLLPGVCPDVHVEVGGASEPFLAVGTRIRTFSRVGPFVKEQLARCDEGFAAL